MKRINTNGLRAILRKAKGLDLFTVSSKKAYDIGKDALIKEGVPAEKILPYKPENMLSKFAKNLMAAQAADEAAKLIYNIPVVGTLLDKAYDGLNQISAKTIGAIPGIGDIYKGFIAWFDKNAAKVFRAIGLDSVADNLDRAAGIHSNHDTWWASKELKAHVSRRMNVVVTEDSNEFGGTSLGAMVQMELELPDIYGTYTTGITGEGFDQAIYKYRQALNFSQTLTKEAVADYLRSVAKLYAKYVTVKKYYRCRNARVIKGNDTFLFNHAYLGGGVRLNGVGDRTTHLNAHDGYTKVTDYIADKDWNVIDKFIELQYLPRALKQFIEYCCAEFIQYKEDTNAYVSFDYGLADMNTLTTSDLKTMLNIAITEVKLKQQAVTAPIPPFLAKFGFEQCVIPETLKGMESRSKTGDQRPMYRVADGTERAAINNIFIRKVEGTGYKYNASADELIISTDKHVRGKITEVDFRNTKSQIDFETEEVNYLSKLVKFFAYSHFYSASIWGYNKAGQPVQLDWGEYDFRFYCETSGTYTYSSQQWDDAVSEMNTLQANQLGSYNSPDIFDAMEFETKFDSRNVGYIYDAEQSGSHYPEGTMALKPRRVLYPEETEIKIYSYSRLLDSMNESVCVSEQYLKKLQDYVQAMNKAIDNAI